MQQCLDLFHIFGATLDNYDRRVFRFGLLSNRAAIMLLNHPDAADLHSKPDNFFFSCFVI